MQQSNVRPNVLCNTSILPNVHLVVHFIATFNCLFVLTVESTNTAKVKCIKPRNNHCSFILSVKQCPTLSVVSSNVTNKDGNYTDTIYGSCDLGHYTVSEKQETFSAYCNESGHWSASYACQSKYTSFDFFFVR